MANNELAVYSRKESASAGKAIHAFTGLLSAIVFGSASLLLISDDIIPLPIRVALIPVFFALGCGYGLLSGGFPTFKKILAMEIRSHPYYGNPEEVIRSINPLKAFLRIPSRQKRILLSRYYVKNMEKINRNYMEKVNSNYIKEIDASHELSHYLVVKGGKITFESVKEPTPHGLWDEALASGKSIYNI